MVAAAGSRGQKQLEELKALVRECTVRLHTHVGNGTGFFVAPQTILTCGHVVGQKGADVVAFWRPPDQPIPCRVLEVIPNPCPPTDAFPDLALLTPVEPITAGHPCVLFSAELADSDPLYVFGYPGEKPGGDEMRGPYEGFSAYDASGTQRLEKSQWTQVLPGTSGSPVLNLRTGKICGMIKRTRDVRLMQDMGGMFIPIPSILSNFLSLEQAQTDFHNQDKRWLDLLSVGGLSGFESDRQLNLAPAAPAYAVLRAEYAALKTAVTGFGVAVAVSAVQGMGGVGKTTLALQLAHDPEIVQIFSDGVLWTTLSNDTTPLDAVRSWIRLLEGRETTARSIETAAAEFRTLLQTRRCLVIVDNARTGKDVEHFMPPNEHSRLVFTTRRQDIAEELGITAISLDVMPEDLALKVVEKTLDRPLEGKERKEAAEVVNLVGRLSIALPMLSERVKKGKSWNWLKGALSNEVSRLEALEPAGGIGRANTRIEACFGISLDEVRQKSAVAYQSFFRLGLLPAGLIFSPGMTATIMGVEEEEAADVLEYLWNEGLLTRNNAKPAEMGTYRVHDLVHGFARRTLSNRSDAQLAREHHEALGRYRSKCQGGWRTLIPDGYIHNWLFWHFERAGQIGAIHQVLRETTEDGRNGWFAARERLGDIDGYLRDVELAWKHSEASNRKSIGLGQRPQGIHIEIERSLQCSSVISRDADYPPAMLVALVRSGTWTLEQSTEQAARYADPRRRVDAFTRLAEESSDTDRARGILVQAVTAALLLAAEGYFGAKRLARALVRAGMLKPTEELLKSEPMLERVFDIDELMKETNSEAVLRLFEGLLREANPHTRLDFLALAAKQASESHSYFASEARRLIAETKDWYCSDGAIEHLDAIAEGEDRETLLNQALDGFGEIRNQDMRRRILTGIARILNPDQLARALELSRELWYPDVEIALLSAVDVDAREERMKRLIGELKDRSISDRTVEMYVLISTATPEWRDAALQEATLLLSKLGVEGDLGRAIQKLAPVVPATSLSNLVESAVRVPRHYERLDALQAIAGREAGAIIDHPIGELTKGLEEYNAVEITANLAHLYPEPERSRLLSDCVKKASLSYYSPDVRLALLPHLQDAEERRSVFQDLVKSTIGGQNWTASESFVRLAAQCPEDFLDDMLQVAIRCPNLELRQRGLSALAPRLSVEQLRRFAGSARMIGDDDAVASASAAFGEDRSGGDAFCPELDLPVGFTVGLGDLLKAKNDSFENKGLRVLVNALARAGRIEQALSLLPGYRFGLDEDYSYTQTVRDLGGLVDFQTLYAAIERKDIPEIFEPLLEVAPATSRAELALRAWRAAREENEWWEQACAVYARFLPEPERRQALDVAINFALNAENRWPGMARHLAEWMDSAERELFARRFRDCEVERLKAVGLLDLAPYRGEKGFD